ncbi:hypothetical protein AK812_SmicGene27755 [Symbiodinium microadriaticum]|uniref:Uncharacterized protein n=1 Tax=Symbiodinium microadriaticum TaxID=2951 RepID=A0A1Q9D637_SYMMI|nr:hypothetical protein AK812_SmicGene27755 [Symbiodinium microadriaticum]
MGCGSSASVFKDEGAGKPMAVNSVAVTPTATKRKVRTTAVVDWKPEIIQADRGLYFLGERRGVAEEVSTDKAPVWQCGSMPPCCKQTWRAAEKFKFAVDMKKMRAPAKRSSPAPGRWGPKVQRD